MTLLKCKNCGDDLLPLEDNPSFGKCESCGSSMSLPNLDDDKKADLYNRANHLRMHHRFEEALKAYEEIIKEMNTEAEAHWCAMLCRFGIEYVKDPGTGEYIPTCHRIVVSPIAQDVDYMEAMKHASVTTRSFYETEAKKIAEVQRNIIAISNQEAPYDIFICYKETDDSDNRTVDSVRAQEIYSALSREGYRVFFARITLEDKLGQQYEPMIFKALSTSKVMLAIGSKFEYFNAPWVRNEWGRFLTFIKEDSSKKLYPCYFDMNAYEIPEELKMLQAQDMGKMGFEQDLVRNIQKVIPLKKNEPQVQVVSAGGPTVENELNRAKLALEDGEWNEAIQFCDNALSFNSETAMAYLYKLCGRLQCSSPENLPYCNVILRNEPDFSKAERFADAGLKTVLQGYLDTFSAAQQERMYDLGRQAVEALARGDIDSTNDFASQALGIDLSYAQMYLVWISANANVRKIEDLSSSVYSAENDRHYPTFCQYATEQETNDFAPILEKNRQAVAEYNEKCRIEKERVAEEMRVQREKSVVAVKINEFKKVKDSGDIDKLFTYAEFFKKNAVYEEAHEPMNQAITNILNLHNAQLGELFPKGQVKNVVDSYTDIYEGTNALVIMGRKFPEFFVGIGAFAMGTLGAFPLPVSIIGGLILLSMFGYILIPMAVIWGICALILGFKGEEKDEVKFDRGEIPRLVKNAKRIAELDSSYQQLLDSTNDYVYTVANQVENKNLKMFPATTVELYSEITGHKDSDTHLQNIQSQYTDFEAIEKATYEKRDELLQKNKKTVRNVWIGGAGIMTVILTVLGGLRDGSIFSIFQYFVGYLFGGGVFLAIACLVGGVVSKVQGLNEYKSFPLMIKMYYGLYVFHFLILLTG